MGFTTHGLFFAIFKILFKILINILNFLKAYFLYKYASNYKL